MFLRHTCANNINAIEFSFSVDRLLFSLKSQKAFFDINLKVFADFILIDNFAYSNAY